MTVPLRVLQVPQDLGDGTTAGPQSPAGSTLAPKSLCLGPSATAGRDPSGVPGREGLGPVTPTEARVFAGGCRILMLEVGQNQGRLRLPSPFLHPPLPEAV